MCLNIVHKMCALQFEAVQPFLRSGVCILTLNNLISQDSIVVMHLKVTCKVFHEIQL
jgi:hypothetical protein